MDSHTTPKRPRPAPAIVLGALVLVAAAMIGVRVSEDGRSGHRQEPPSSLEPAGSNAAMIGGAGLPDPPTVAALMDDVSADPPVRAFFREPDWLRRAILATEAVAAGRVPRDAPGFSAPTGRFAVERVGPDTVLGPTSFSRYDAIAEAVGSISPAAVRALMITVGSSIGSAYGALGGRSVPFEQVVGRALVRVEAAPVPGAELVVRQDGPRFVFVDPRLEALGDLEKLLLRMGPRNARVVQDKAAEIREALGFDAPMALAR